MAERPRGAESGRPRRAASGILIALAVGSLAALVRHDATSLAPSGQMPGLLEWIATGLANASRNMPVGSWLHSWHLLAVASTVAVFVLLGRTITGSWIGAAPALALGLTAPFAPILAPPDTLAVALVALSLLVVVRDQTSWRFDALAVATSAVVPALAPAYAIAWIVLRRGARANPKRFAYLALIASTPALVMVVPRLPDSLSAANDWSFSVGMSRVIDAAWSIAIAPAGPYALGLAALGALFVHELLPRGTRTAVGMLALVAALASGFPGVQSLRALAPLVVLLWMFVAMGLRTLVRECRPNLGGHVAAALLVALLPALQAVRVTEPLLPSQFPRGHDTLTPAAFGRFVSALPDDAVVVTEDASTDVLWRSLRGSWRRAGKTLHMTDADAADLAAVVASRPSRVFALPTAQLALQNLGFRLTAAPPPQRPGVAELTWMETPCTTLTEDWQDVTRAATFRTVAMIADDDASRGAVEMRVAGPDAFAPAQVGWPAFAMSAFSRELFDRANPEDVSGLLASLDDARAPRDTRLVDASHNLALTFWRRAGAPRALAVDLGGTASFALARHAPGERQRLRLCPAFPYVPDAIGQ